MNNETKIGIWKNLEPPLEKRHQMRGIKYGYGGGFQGKTDKNN